MTNSPDSSLYFEIVESRRLADEAARLLQNNVPFVNLEDDNEELNSVNDGDDNDDESEYEIVQFNCRAPEIEIFAPNCQCWYFSQSDLTLHSFGYKDNNTLFESLLLKIPPVQIVEILSNFTAMHQSCNVINSQLYFLYVFYMIGVSDNVLFAENGKEVLKLLLKIKEDSIKDYFTSADIFTVLLNFGAPVEAFHGIKCLSTNSAKLNKIYQFRETTLHLKNWLCNLNCILKILQEIINSLHFTSLELHDIIILLLWISLDKKLMLKETQFLITDCINTAIKAVDLHDWKSVLSDLSDTISFRMMSNVTSIENYKVIAHLLSIIPINCRRGRLLQRKTAYKILYSLSRLKNAKSILSCNVKINLDFLIKVLKTIFRNITTYKHEQLFAVALLIDYCIGYYIYSRPVNLIEKLSDLLREFCNKLNDKDSQTKEYLCRIMCRMNTL